LVVKNTLHGEHIRNLECGPILRPLKISLNPLKND